MEENTVLHLTSADELLSQEIIKNGNNEKKLSTIVTEAPIDSILKLALCDSNIDNLCKTMIFYFHWIEIWETYENNRQAQKPLKTIDCFDLLKGRYLLKIYENAKENDKKIYQLYLKQSAELGTYKSAVLFLKDQTDDLQKRFKEDKNFLISLDTFIEKVGEIQWTPAYVLAASVYIKIAIQSNDFLTGPFLELQKIYFSKAFFYVKMAELMEPYSAATIQNAYHGEELQNIIARETGIKATWESIKTLIIERANKELSISEITALIDKSRNKSNEIKKQYHLDSTLDVIKINDLKI